MLVLAIVPLAMAAQVKIATVDVQAIFNAMPETKTTAETLENASKQYKAEYEMMQAEFNSKYEAYQAMTASKDVPQTIRDRRIREIQDGDREIEAFLEKSKSLLNEQKHALEAPIYDKIQQAIKQVGDAGGYTYIIDVSKTPVVYSGPTAIDLIRGEGQGARGEGISQGGSIYTLQGQRVASPTHRLPAGIYVQDGRKIAVR